MGHKVETVNGVEHQVHAFDTQAAATHYLSVSRTFTYDRTEGGLLFYYGPNFGERAALRKRGDAWAVSFWQE